MVVLAKLYIDLIAIIPIIEYNILIMEEKQTIIACGAGASTKVVFHNEGDENHSVRIERIENVKDVRSYVERIDEMIERKRKFFGENEF